MAVGLPFLPAALGCFLPRHHPLLPLAAKVWRPSRATVFYIVAEFLTLVLVALLYMWSRSFWDVYPIASLLVSDIVWRSAGPLLMGAFLLIRGRHAFRLLGLRGRPDLKLIAGMISLGAIFDWAAYLALRSFASAEDLLGLSDWEEGAAGLCYVLLSAVVLAPLAEEVVFRGFLFQSYLKRFGFALATIVSTVLFVTVHHYGIYGSVSVAFFGLGACALYRTTGSLWTAILFHALSNALITGLSWPLYYGS